MLLYPKAGSGRLTAMLLSQQNLFLGGMNSSSPQASLLALASPRDKQSRKPIDVRLGRTVRTSAAGKHSFQSPLGMSRMRESLQFLCSPIAAHYVDRI